MAAHTHSDELASDREVVRGDRSLLLVGAVSFSLTMLYAHFRFVPFLHDLADTYDAFRYHKFAEQAGRFGVFEGLGVEGPFQQPGYPRMLTVLYAIFGESAYVGCAFNWVIWCVAGLIAAPAVQRPGRDDRALQRTFLML